MHIKLPKLDADAYRNQIPSPIFAFMLRSASSHVGTYNNDMVISEVVNGHAPPRPFATALERINELLVRPVLVEAKIVIATAKSYA